MIRNTERDLEDHLEEVNARLQALTPPSNDRLVLEQTDVERFKNERDSTEQCLRTADRTPDSHAEEAPPPPPPSPPPAVDEPPAEDDPPASTSKDKKKKKG